MIQFPWFKICLDLSSRYCLSYTKCFFVQCVVSGWIYFLSSPQHIETKTKLRKETNWIYVRLVKKAPLKILHKFKISPVWNFPFPKKSLFMIHKSNIHSLLSRKTSCFSNFFFFISSRSTCPNQRWQMLFIAMLVNVTGVLVVRILRTRIAASFADHFRHVLLLLK